ncbi:anti-sigma factor antagonist [Nodosilinea sp. LEGE 06152]|uniref:anti-sigma factor antagonist n=1 Tax=Nodosilinea sp. LEGE 06152 TaxID=2777966 RepID=UPI00188295AF|nr:anti-sigma factor antagonist [Nodosilinea sp. LEGE 06152]MBE9157841.1 anti-sigma factor antagonist [Nodosilinea sp. LEGE 06152]
MTSSIAPDQDPQVVAHQPAAEDLGTVCVVGVPSTLTVVEAVEFEKQVKHHCLSQPVPESIIIDLSQTEFIDSSGLGALVICYRTCKAKGVEMVLRGVQEQVRMVLALTDLEQLFTFEAVSGEPEAPVAKPEMRFVALTAHPSVTSRGKRALDIVGALVGLAITAVLSVPIVLAIKLEDGGPILFKQVRCSWMGKRFEIWKFRSMVINAEALKAQVENEVEGPLFKNENDPRITKVGRFLRRTSLDELPQFWNVLRGDMSLVGTRPPTPDEIEQYKVPEWQRLDVKPGMTGEWQVNGRSTVKKFEDVIRMDLDYQKNWSLAYDVQLIIKTVLVLFSKKAGAA